METKLILPVIDTEALQKKANEAAQKGAEKAIEDFYTAYDSPYKKAIQESLHNKGLDNTIEIPDIIGILNEQISKEIDQIANTAISKTFIPLIKEFLTRAKSELKLSDILKEFIECTGYEYDDDKDQSDYSLQTEKDDGSFVYLKISDGKTTYQVHFYFSDSKNKDKDKTKRTAEIYALPYTHKDTGYRVSSPQTMKVSLDGVTLELPFTPDVLKDKFTSYIAKLVIANTQITFDVDDFYEDMFPQDECHCD